MDMEYVRRKGFKGQAVMEYLITYGLALFVILIVLAILVAVVLPSLKAPESCQFTQPGFTCNQRPHVIVADNDNDVDLRFQLDNSQGKSVNVLGVLCSTAAPGNIRKTDIEDLTTPVPMAAGQAITVGGTGATIPDTLNCVDEAGTTVKLSPGSNFRGSIGILYKFSEDLPTAPERLAVATVSGTVTAED